MPRAVELIAGPGAFPRATRGRPPTPEWPAERALPTQMAGKAATGDKLWNTFSDAPVSPRPCATPRFRLAGYFRALRVPASAKPAGQRAEAGGLMTRTSAGRHLPRPQVNRLPCHRAEIGRVNRMS